MLSEIHGMILAVAMMGKLFTAIPGTKYIVSERMNKMVMFKVY